MKGVLNHYHDEDTWRWGIPEKPKRGGRWLVALAMVLVVAISAAFGVLLYAWACWVVEVKPLDWRGM